jgi:hypothetical protein
MHSGLAWNDAPLSGVVEGVDFPVVWLCTEAGWTEARVAAREPTATPWPAEDVETSGGELGGLRVAI